MLNFRRETTCQILFSFPLVFIFLLGNSCEQGANSSGNSESELINKINAVHQQMMIQGNISDEEKQAILGLASLVSNDDGFGADIAEAIQFEEVENSPVYPGCEDLSGVEAKACFKEGVSKFVKAEFNAEIAKDIGITGPQSVEVFFQIDELGKMSNLKVRDADVAIQAEIARVLRKLPNMKPAIQNGKEVPVLCSISVPYGVE